MLHLIDFQIDRRFGGAYRFHVQGLADQVFMNYTTPRKKAPRYFYTSVTNLHGVTIRILQSATALLWVSCVSSRTCGNMVAVMGGGEVLIRWTLGLWPAWHTINLGYDQSFSFDLRPKSWVTTWMQVKAKTCIGLCGCNKDPRCVRKRQSEPRYACLWKQFRSVQWFI
jgi:hypothetical protein